MASLDVAEFTEPGLYLRFPNGESLALTSENIDGLSRALLSDPTKIPRAVQEAEAFQLCSICPMRGSGDSCHAIRPILAVWEPFDKYASYDRVTAVYRGGTDGTLVCADTTVQRALQYVSVLSLMYFCEVGKKYWRYFYGVHPLMSTDDLVIRVYLNMFWACGGEMPRTKALVDKFHEEISITTACQMERIRLVCHNDAFLNALILTQLASEFLSMDVERLVKDHVQTFEQSFFR